MKMLKLFSYPILIALAAVFVSSCSKERIEEQQTLNQYNSPDSYLDSKKQDEQEFIIDSTGTGPIIGNQGTHIWGSKDCLVMPNGDSVTFPFTVKLVELYTPKDMIYYRMPTVSAGNILETGGEIRLRAFKGNDELSLRPGCPVMISMPNSSPQPNYMRVFYGFDNGSFIDWTDNLASLGVTPTQSPTFAVDTIGYRALIERLGWLNCDRLAGTGGSTLSFTSTVDDLTNVAFFIFIPAYKTVMQAYNLTAGLIPNGSDIKIVAIAVNSSNDLFSFYQTMTVNGNSTVNVTMSQTTDADLTALLNGL